MVGRRGGWGRPHVGNRAKRIAALERGLEMGPKRAQDGRKGLTCGRDMVIFRFLPSYLADNIPTHPGDRLKIGLERWKRTNECFPTLQFDI